MKPDTDLKEVIRNEVKEAIKSIISETVKEEIKTITTGDYNPPVTMKSENTGIKDKEVYQLPVTVKKPDGSIEHRRRKRTQPEMQAAIAKALPVVTAKHPTWSERRRKRLATNLVRRYKIAN